MDGCSYCMCLHKCDLQTTSCAIVLFFSSCHPPLDNNLFDLIYFSHPFAFSAVNKAALNHSAGGAASLQRNGGWMVVQLLEQRLQIMCTGRGNREPTCRFIPVISVSIQIGTGPSWKVCYRM